jgi:hypothetical protein
VPDGVSLDNCVGIKPVGADVGCDVGSSGPCKGISLLMLESILILGQDVGKVIGKYD